MKTTTTSAAQLSAGRRAGARQLLALGGLLLALGLGGPAARAQAPGLSFTFTLPHAYLTSAGVYARDGHRVRVLWKKKTYDAGPHTAQWDGKNDAGGAVAGDTYTVKVLYHNMTYTWDGVIGNTSASFTGFNQTWHLNVALPDLAITPDGTTAFTANGYSEGKPSASRFATARPQLPTAVVYDEESNGHANSPLQLVYAATDGTRTYYAHVGNGWQWVSFVLAVDVANDQEAAFAGGHPYKLWEHTYQSVIDQTDPDARGQPVSPPTGLAVQHPGNLLAVAHGLANEVRLFDKVTGVPRGIIPFPGPGRLAFAPNGDLWIISTSGRYVERRANVGSTNGVAATITGLARPLGVAVNPLTSQVLVSDGGGSQQIKCYDPAGGAPRWTLGDLGGYAADPTVTNTRFYLDAPVPYGDSQPGQATGDAGNLRNLHFAADRTYLEQIAYVGLTHTCTVDVNNPTRVFSEGMLEYRMDYTKPLQPGDPDPAHGGNGSWQLVRNWAPSAPANYERDLTSVATLANGRAYGLVYNPQDAAPHNPYNKNWTVVELPASGPLRDTGIRLAHVYDPSDSGNRGFIYPNGELRYRVSPNDGPTQSFYRQALSGFDPSNNPQWGPPELLASVPARPLAIRTIPVTSSGVLVVHQGNASDTTVYADGTPDYRLAGVPLTPSAAATSLAWLDMAPISNYGAQFGPYDHTPSDGLGGFGIHAFGGLTGTEAFAAGQHILAYYNGQGNLMSNQWSDWWDDGLFVGQFGGIQQRRLTNTASVGASIDAPPGLAYNVTGPAVAQYNGTTYTFLADESAHSGIHRWRLAGQVRELVGSGDPGSPVALGPAGAWPEANLVLNPSFEAEAATATPSGWVSTEAAGSAGAAASAASNEARSFPYVGRHALPTPYQAYTYQVLKELPNDTYTLSAWVRSSGGQSTALLLARTAGAAPTQVQAAIPASATWQKITLPGLVVTTGSCEIGFQSVAGGGQWLEVDDVDLRAAPAAPLPVELTHFGAELRGDNQALLRWATASEQNSAYFAVERSADGAAFQEIGRRAAAGHSTQPRTYELPDPRPLTARTYYRLRQVEADAKSTYSAVVALAPRAGGPQVSLYPNPAPGPVARLALRGLAGQPLTVRVLDGLGRLVASQALVPATDLAEAPLRLPATARPGLYLVRVSDDARAWTIRWVLAP